MTHVDEIKSTAFQEAFRTARRVAGKQAVHMVLVSHGSRSGHLEDVPEAKRSACQAALEKLARDGAPADSKATRGDGFDSVRERAYGKRERPTTPTSLESLAENAFARFNNPPTHGDD